MTDIELINKLIASTKPSDIFNDDWKDTYRSYSKLIHPDYNPNSLAAEAMAKMNMYKDLIENGKKYIDEAGDFRVFDKRIEYVVTDANRTLINKSVNNYKLLMSKTDNASLNFQKYLPQNMMLEKDKLTINFKYRSIPLTGLQLEQVHVNWLFSRLFEFVLWLRQINYVHMGLNPTTVFAVPENHGIIIISFYHMTNVYKKALTISAKYKMWYPTLLFSKKEATPDIDLELSKKIALYLLGDKSAAGTKLKINKDVNQEILTFLLTKHENHVNEYKKYRELLAKNFEKKFFVLSL